MDHQIIVIDAQLEILDQQERSLLHLITSIRAQKSNLNSDRRKLIHSAQADTPTWNPSKLNPDVLLIIFEMVIDEQEEDNMTAPLTISHVCWNWRQIAISCPHLWSKLVVRLGLGDRNDNFELLQLYTDRAGGFDGSQISNANRLKDLAEMISIRSDYVSSLSWLCECASMTEFPLSILHTASSFPRLTSLLLHFDSSVSGLSRSWFHQSRPTNVFPSLRSLVLKDVYLEHLPINIHHNLRILDLSFTKRSGLVYMSHLRTVLAETVSLEELKFSNFTLTLDMTLGELHQQQVRPGRWTIDSTPPVSLQRLTKLSWSNPPVQHFYIFFLFFPTPCLEHLQLTLGYDTDNDKGHWERAVDSHGIMTGPGTFTANPNPSMHAFNRLTQLQLNITSYSSTHLRDIFERMEFPLLRQLNMIGRTLDEQNVALPSAEFIFQNSRLDHLTHLALSSVSLDKIRSFFTHAPSIEHLYLNLNHCPGAASAICSLSPATCGCPGKNPKEHGTVNKERRLLQKLSTIELSRCKDLNLACLRALVSDRNICGDGREARRLARFVGGRDSRPEPTKITSIKFVDCVSVSDEQAGKLRDVVDTVICTKPDKIK